MDICNFIHKLFIVLFIIAYSLNIILLLLLLLLLLLTIFFDDNFIDLVIILFDFLKHLLIYHDQYLHNLIMNM